MANISYAAKAARYAKRVVSGKIMAGSLVKAACSRHLKDLKDSKRADFPYRFDVKKVHKICDFAEGMVHIKGKWATSANGLPYIHLEDWQCFLLGVAFGWVRKSDGLRRFREIYAEIPRKNAKALALDTPIPTPNGWTTQGELKTGDLVFGPDGSVRRVIATTEVMHGRPCYRLTTWDGESIIADAGHEWLTDARADRDRLKGVKGKTGGPKPSVKTTEQIAGSLYCRKELNHRIAVAGPIEIERVVFSIQPYVLGAWLGDGHSAGARITIGEFDQPEMLGFLAAEGQAVAGSSRNMTYSLSSGRGRNRSACLHVRLRSAGLLGNKHIPQEYLRGSIDQRMALLQGLMDTDGTVSKAGQCSFTTTSSKLASGIEELLWSLGFKPTVRTDRAKLNGRIIGPCWQIQFWAWSDTAVFRLSRKLERLKPRPDKLTRSRTRQITSCEPVDSVPVKCIQIDSEDGMYLAGRTFLPTHNSTIGAIIGLYMAFDDSEKGAEVFAGATSMDQAYAVFRVAWLMVKNNPEFREHFGLQLGGTEANPGNIYQLSTGSYFKPMIGKPGDGDSPHCAIVDEYHEHTTPVMYDAMKTGMGSRSQPMRPVITTAGVDTSGPCYDKHNEAIKVLDGTLDNPELFTMIFGIDAAKDGDPEGKGDDWADFRSWKKANPNYGVSVFEDYLRGQLRDALQNPSQQNINRTKHLNEWMNAGVAWMNMALWGKCTDDTLKLTDFTKKECWLAFDLANKIDIASLAFLFKTGAGFAFFCKHYLCEDTIELRQNSHYRKWRDQGWLIQTDGARTDFRMIEEEIRKASLMFSVQNLSFDPREASYLVSSIQNWASFECVEITQGPQMMSEPMKEMEAQIYANTLKHNGDPVLTWMMGNVVKKEGRGGGEVKYYYPTKQNNANKIDGIVAGIMALGRAMVTPEHKEFQLIAL